MVIHKRVLIMNDVILLSSVKFCTVSFLEHKRGSPNRCGSVGWALSRKAKLCGFHFWSAHIPGLWACLQSGHVQEAMTDVSLALFLPPLPSL